jgi:hypothetical protein
MRRRSDPLQMKAPYLRWAGRYGFLPKLSTYGRSYSQVAKLSGLHFNAGLQNRACTRWISRLATWCSPRRESPLLLDVSSLNLAALRAPPFLCRAEIQ